MNGGIGPQSYARNSLIQRKHADSTTQAMSEEITKKLDISQLHCYPLNSFHVADFGCSTGPNTFEAIKIIIEAVKLKWTTAQEFNSQVPEFQVFFSDIVSNDFNTLFSSLPPEREYYASGVPGSFYERLLPQASLHFAYSSCSLNWLSEIPADTIDKNSEAWSTERINYSSDQTMISKLCYSDQFGKDLKSFLKAREMELVDGGLMCLVVSGIENENSLSQTVVGLLYEVLETCLTDMANKGLVSKEKIDDFNMPTYFPTLTEMETLIKENKSFIIERMEVLNLPENYLPTSRLKQARLGLKAVSEGLFVKHFGSKVTEKLFELLAQRFDTLAIGSSEYHGMSVLFAFLKRANRII